MDNNLLREIKKMEMSKSWKTSFFQYGLALNFFLGITGAYLFFIEDMNTFDMFILLSHMFLGLLLVVPCVMMFQRHKLYSKLWNNKKYFYLGYLTNISLWFVFLGGTLLLIVGKTISSFLWWSHVITGLMAIFLLCFYIYTTLSHSLTPLKKGARDFFYRMIKSIAFKVSLSISILILINLTFSYLRVDFDPIKIVKDYSLTIGSTNVFFPSKLTTEHGGFYKEKAFVNSNSCGTTGCHSEILDQWKDSMHLRSPSIFVEVMRDQLIKEGKSGQLFGRIHSPEMQKLNDSEIAGRQIFRKCAGCHAPVNLITGTVTPLQEKRSFKTHEGSSCIFCHSLSQIKRDGGNHHVISPERYLFAFSNNPIAKKINNLMINAKPGMHTKTFMRKKYTKSSYCISCHNRLHYKSWENSAYAKDPKKKKRCQDCHMQRVETDSDVSAYHDGKVADHRFIAAGLTNSKYYQLDEQYRLTENFLKDKKIEIKILAPKSVLNSKFKKFKFSLAIGNIGVGHDFPVGPEGDMIQAWPQITIRRLEDRVILYQYGHLDKDNYLDESKVYVYKIKAYGDHKFLIDKDIHPSWRFFKDQFFVIPPLQYDIQHFEAAISMDRDFEIEVKFKYRRPNQKFVDRWLGKGVLKVPDVDMDSQTTRVLITEMTREAEESSSDLRSRFKEAAFFSKELTKKSSNGEFDQSMYPLIYSVRIAYAIKLLDNKKDEAAYKILNNFPNDFKNKKIVQNLLNYLRRRLQIKE